MPVLQTRWSVVAEMRLPARPASSVAMPPMSTDATSSREMPMAAVTVM